MSAIKITYQQEFRQELPYFIKAGKDYRQYRELLETMDVVLRESDIERELAEYFLMEARKKAASEGVDFRGEAQNFYKHARKVLRLCIGRKLTQEGFRGYSCRLAESLILQEFCTLISFGQITVRIPGKSTLQEYEQSIPVDILKRLSDLLLKAVSDKAPEAKNCGFKKALDLSECYIDTTCLEANIHYPADWVLLKDAVRSLMKATETIRKRGIRNRMGESPYAFISRMNALAMKMSYAARQKEGKKKRKAFFREMKKLLKKVALHAERHLSLLQEQWHETDLSEGEKNQIVYRIERVLKQLPEVVVQANRRIISGQKIDNKEKVLSLYEPDIEVIIRKKSGKEVEFGNVLSLIESRDGLLVDCELYKKKIADTVILRDRIESLETRFGEGQIKKLCGDRGFFSAANKKYLHRKGIVDYTAPRSPRELQERTEEADGFFIAHQKRRAQTEGRIGIFKNVMLGSPFRNKGFDSRETGVMWSVLAHNVWVIARKIIEQKENEKKSTAQRAA